MKKTSFIRRRPIESLVGLSAAGLLFAPLVLGWGNPDRESNQTAIDLSQPSSQVDTNLRDTSVVTASSNLEDGQIAAAPIIDGLSPDEFAKGVEDDLKETIADKVDPWSSLDGYEEEIAELMESEEAISDASDVLTESLTAEPAAVAENNNAATDSLVTTKFAETQAPETAEIENQTVESQAIVVTEPQTTAASNRIAKNSVDPPAPNSSNDFQLTADTDTTDSTSSSNAGTDFTWNPELAKTGSNSTSDKAVIASVWKSRIQQSMIVGSQTHQIDLDTAVIEALNSSPEIRIARASQTNELANFSSRDRFSLTLASLKDSLTLLSKTSSTPVVITDANFLKNERRKRQQIQSHIVSVVDAYWMLYQARANLAIELANAERVTEVSNQLNGYYQNSSSQNTSYGNQLARIEAVAANRESSLVKARYSLLNAQEKLISLVSGLDSTPNNIELIPQDEPMEYRLAYDMQTAEELAMRFRPEVQDAADQLQANADSRPLVRDLKMEKAIGDVQHSVRLAYRNTQGIQQEVDSNRKAVTKAAKELEHVESQFQSASTENLSQNLALEDLLTTQQRLAVAEQRLINSLARVSVAHVLLKKATGELLENDSLVGDQPTNGASYQHELQMEQQAVPDQHQVRPVPTRAVPSPPRTAKSHRLKTGFRR